MVLFVYVVKTLWNRFKFIYLFLSKLTSSGARTSLSNFRNDGKNDLFVVGKRHFLQIMYMRFSSSKFSNKTQNSWGHQSVSA